MSLRRRMQIIIAVMLVAVIAVSYVHSNYLILEKFKELDEQNAEMSIRRTVGALDYYLSGLSVLVNDWAQWDDTYYFIQNCNGDYLRSNLTDSTFSGLEINLMLFIDEKGEIVFEKGYDLERGVEVPISQSLKNQLTLDCPFLNHKNIESSNTGIIDLPENPMLIVASPILTSEGEGPARGTLIFGRYFDSGVVKNLSEIAQLPVEVHRYDDEGMPQDFKSAQSRISDVKPVSVEVLSKNSIAGYALLDDIYGKPTLIMKAEVSRDIFRQGQSTTRSYVLIIGLFGVIFGSVSLFITDKLVFSRILRLNRDITNIGIKEDISARVSMSGDDELSKMADSVNNMLAALEHSQERLWEEEGRYRMIFEESPISLWEEDFSEVKRSIEELRHSGVKDFKLFFDEYPEEVSKCIKLIKIKDVNKASIKLFNTESKGLFEKYLDKLFTKDAFSSFKEWLVLIAENRTGFEGELTAFALNEEKINIYLKWVVAPGYEASYSKLLFSVIDITESKKAEESLKHLSSHDPLTDLYNRAFFEEQMKVLSKERNINVGVLVLDMDGLKYVNDVFGHQHGDKLLIDLSRMLLKIFRPSDIVARIGGDEFAVLVRDVEFIELEGISERLRSNIELHNKKLSKRQNPINISIGIALKNSNLKTIEQTFKEADEYLFREKIPKREDVRKSILNVIKATMYEKDHPTEEHMWRLKDLADKFGGAMNLSNEDRIKLILTTELHDIGKIMVPDYILNKRGPLSMGEFQVIEKHTEAGYRIAKATPEIANIADFILHSHERWDGTGYPGRLKGEDIPLISRMVFILDAYDAMTNDRPYRKALSNQEAIEELKKNANTQFDPYLVDVFISDVLQKSELI